ncbi:MULTISPECIES: pentapeptide repeat-containing protein [unclassified Cyanobium]|uniref:pentapeptide repeat-containing protein n=1 Tax=unclassified Cyanobium TaxID=2627006 RepID=UPI001646637B|nr:MULTISPECIES: pentapeptide repeat-containing protein [unclassified Cyanobium]MBE9152623.1 pentapeptide repeat-containing protein [Cyanobium sp. LEGE 06113]MBE9153172.1 pentapeptide repeat-containing protein [Cyanobium sp. LEGE 06113]QNI71441.1 pentapeptide repeats family protein [Cyanobium sp. NS01]
MRQRPTSTWYDQQQRRRRSPFFRQLDRSFQFRVLIAAACSFVLLSAVNRFENCHRARLEPDCLTSNYLEIISIDNAEAFSIVAAAFVFIFEAGKRREREHHEMLDLLLSDRQAGTTNSLGRIRALEDLSAAGIWQDDFDLQRANLEGLHIPFSRWRGANFSGTVLRHADLHGVDLQGADFSDADLSGADLSAADLRGASFLRARLHQADLRGARLTGTDFQDADLSQALSDQPLPPSGTAASGPTMDVLSDTT